MELAKATRTRRAPPGRPDAEGAEAPMTLKT